MGANDPARLEYEDRVVVAMRKQYRLLLALTLLNTILLAGFVAGPTFLPYVKAQWQQFQERREQRRVTAAREAAYAKALVYTAPPDRIIYEERPTEAQKLLAGGGYKAVRGQVAYFPSRPWQVPVQIQEPPEAAALAPVTRDGALVFAHMLKEAPGNEYLVCVQLVAEQRSDPRSVNLEQRYVIQTYRALRVMVESSNGIRFNNLSFEMRSRNSVVTITRGTDRNHPGTEFDERGLFRIYAGQIDPGDATHFTIPYELDGKPGVIDGRLTGGSPIVELFPRQGTIVDRRGNTEVWDPSATPTSALPTTAPAR